MIKTRLMSVAVAVVVLGFAVGSIIRAQQQKQSGSMSQKQMECLHKRGDQAMGFDRLKTTHHFVLATDGGTIRVDANDAQDNQSRDQIRMHLRHVAIMFNDGNFEVPIFIHAENPPGIETMRRLKSEIKYQYKKTDRGALVQISTTSSEALEAIHGFLRYQITQHTTGDPLEVTRKAN